MTPVRKKIQALLALANGTTNEHEASAALRAAEKLIAAHPEAAPKSRTRVKPVKRKRKAAGGAGEVRVPKRDATWCTVEFVGHEREKS